VDIEHRREEESSASLTAKPLGKISVRALVVLQWFFYAGFVFLWFKDNISPLKKFRLSPAAALIPLIGIIGVRIALKIWNKKPRRRLKFDPPILVLASLLLLTAVVRLPFLLHPAGMMTSDDAIPALMGKHILEGKVPPICYYGQQYLGSLSSHFYALFFWIFGYSILTLKAATLVLYLAAIAVQFYLFKAIFTWRWAVILSLGAGLPLGQLVSVSLDNASSYPLVLFLGALMMLVSYRVAFQCRNRLIPLLGFLMGLSFWTHEITAVFILTALVVFAVKVRPFLKSGAILLLYAVLGGLPLVLQETFSRFQMAAFLVGGERETLNWEKWRGAARLFRSLLLPGKNPSLVLFLAFILLGTAILLVQAFKKRGAPAQALYPLFLVVFFAIYLLSRFSDKGTARYMFLLYFSLPVFLAAPFLWLKTGWKYLLCLILIAGLSYADGRTAYTSTLESVTYRQDLYRELVSVITKTGIKNWQGEYWTAYLLTAIGKERFLIDSFSTNRYLPYRLGYYDRQGKGHYILNTEGGRAANLEQMLIRLGIPFDKKISGDCTLLYNIDGPVFPEVLDEIIPSEIPDLEVGQIRAQNGYLELVFINHQTQEPSEFRLEVEIPGYSARTRVFAGTSEKIPLRIPYPPGAESLAIKYSLDYKSLKIPSSVRSLSFTPSGGGFQQRKEPLVFLRGVSPIIHLAGKDVRYCDKEAVLEVNAPAGKKMRLRLILNSPFQFSDVSWYGNYIQGVQIHLSSGRVFDRDLEEGSNALDFEIENAAVASRPIVVTLKFRYQCLFDFAALRKMSAILESAQLIE